MNHALKLRRWSIMAGATLTAALLVGMTAPGPSTESPAPEPVRAAGAPGIHTSSPIPSFSRQTKLPCSSCHDRFPQLNAFGRMFKLNGYTLTAVDVVEAEKDSRKTLEIGLIPPVSTMLQSSVTWVRKTEPGTQNGDAALPQQWSVFVGGKIAPKLGGFFQFTYDGQDGGISVDNLEVRFAGTTSVSSKNVLYGLTLNNNPTMSDIWNTTPAWGFPFLGSGVAPAPAAATLVNGGLSQNVLGLTAYGLLSNRIYTEFGLYRTALQGGPSPPDATASGVIEGVAPYWRVAYQGAVGGATYEVGSFGLDARLFPSGIGGATDRYTDIGLDAQIQRRVGPGSLVGRGRWILEDRRLDATFLAGGASRPSPDLQALNVNASYTFDMSLGLDLGVFTLSGDSDPLLYAPGAVDGSRTGEPGSTGFLAQLSYMPWLNTRLGLQYTAFTRFNGASRNYDGFGRSAGANDALYLFTWLAF